MPIATVSIHVPRFETNAALHSTANERCRRGASKPPTHTVTVAVPCSAMAAARKFPSAARCSTTGTSRRATPLALLRITVVGLVSIAAFMAGCSKSATAQSELSAKLSSATEAAKEGAPKLGRTIRNNATCLGSEITDRIGKQDAQALIDARGDLDKAGDEVAASAAKLKVAIGECIDVRDTLVETFAATGMTSEQAACVADQVMQDDNLLTPLLVNIIFGDPGIGTAVFVAVRATRGCLTPAEIARLFPGL